MVAALRRLRTSRIRVSSLLLLRLAAAQRAWSLMRKLGLAVVGCMFAVACSSDDDDEPALGAVDVEVESVEDNELAFALRVTTDSPAEITAVAERAGRPQS